MEDLVHHVKLELLDCLDKLRPVVERDWLLAVRGLVPDF